MLKKSNLIIVSMLLLLSSCGKYVWEEQKSIEDMVWDKSEEVVFVLPMHDDSTMYNMYVDVRNITSYPYSNLYLFVKAKSPNGGVTIDTINYTLANEKGQWLGKGTFSKYISNRLPFRKYIKFPAKGNYIISVKHGMRRDKLEGVSNIGLVLEKSEN